jgi:hypothetical protein
MGRAHARLELIGCRVVPLERQQAGGEHLRLLLRFHAEQIEHRKLTDIHAAQPQATLERIKYELIVQNADRSVAPGQQRRRVGDRRL